MKKKKIKILHVAQAAGGVDRYIRKIWNCEYISKVRKIQLSLFAWSFPVYVLFYHIYKKKHPVA